MKKLFIIPILFAFSIFSKAITRFRIPFIPIQKYHNVILHQVIATLLSMKKIILKESQYQF